MVCKPSRPIIQAVLIDRFIGGQGGEQCNTYIYREYECYPNSYANDKHLTFHPPLTKFPGLPSQLNFNGKRSRFSFHFIHCAIKAMGRILTTLAGQVKHLRSRRLRVNQGNCLKRGFGGARVGYRRPRPSRPDDAPLGFFWRPRAWFLGRQSSMMGITRPPPYSIKVLVIVPAGISPVHRVTSREWTRSREKLTMCSNLPTARRAFLR